MGRRSMSEVAVVTGASGFIGRWIRDAFLERGFDVLALRRPASPPASVGRSAEVTYEDVDGLGRLFERERPRYIVHVAGATKGVTYGDFERANVRPTASLLQAVKKSGAPLARFIHMSSLVSHGPSSVEQPHVEGAPPKPVEFYGRSKLEAEQVVTGSDVPWTILRPGGVYGPGDVDYFNLFQSAARGLNVYFGNRKRVFSKIYISDMVDATIEAGLSPSAEDRAYFVCDRDPVSWERFQSTIAARAARPVRDIDLPGMFVDLAAFGGEVISTLDRRPRLFNRQKAIMGRQEAWTCDSEAITREVGFTPRVDLEEGVERSWAWYREQGWVPSPKAAT